MNETTTPAALTVTTSHEVEVKATVTFPGGYTLAPNGASYNSKPAYVETLRVRCTLRQDGSLGPISPRARGWYVKKDGTPGGQRADLASVSLNSLDSAVRTAVASALRREAARITVTPA